MRTLKAVRPLLAAAIAALSLAFATGAFGAPGKHHHHSSASKGGRHVGALLIDESVAPSMPTDPAFHGVTPGAAPWVLKSGHLRLRRNGQFNLRVKGLEIPSGPFAGTPGPVTTISASLYCGADTNLVAAGTTQQVRISRKGNARIHDRSFTVPATCLAPVILVHPNGIATTYIAVLGWRFA
jgi:hypothetical protein